jgi:hypothetical protein
MLKKLTVALLPISMPALLTITIASALNAPAALAHAQPQQAAVVCAGDTPPKGMVITATGSSPVCAGSCTARQIQAVSGSIMIICARQPIPDDYSLESVTSSPNCKCLGDSDNAYIIRQANKPSQTAVPPENQPTVNQKQPFQISQ